MKRFITFSSILLVSFIMIFGALTPQAQTAPAEKPVVVGSFDGSVVPVTAEYCKRVIKHAENLGAAACVIEISCPGGLFATTQEIVSSITNAQVPVIVYVSPAGGWAGSAGTFITVSSHIAAMAPGSRIGAASPVSIGGQENQPDDVSSKKISEDAAAWIRSLAQLREKNADAAEKTVTESKSYSDTEALKLNLIDLIAKDLEYLLEDVDGQTVTLNSGQEVRLETKDAPVERVPLNSIENILLYVSNPDLAYILMTIGMAGIMVEIYSPGLIFPGVLGAISLLLGLYSLGTLNASWGGVLLMILAFALFVAEAFAASNGLLAAGGIVSFISGSLLLFSGGPPGIGINIGLIVATTLILTALVVILVIAIVRGQKKAITTGNHYLIGKEAVVRTDLQPEGTVFVAGELWNAAADDTIKAGERVLITEIDGLKLTVKRFD
ncbi:MAG TPA: serine protease [Peptococcaceae bacterium]|nr:serine protease [Peptococcaceae bacterium]